VSDRDFVLGVRFDIDVIEPNAVRGQNSSIKNAVFS
jgi:hypothetical protein